MGDINKHCPMCGARPGEPCTVISGGEGLSPGDDRPDVHWARNNDEPFGPPLIPDEPDYAER